MTDINKEKRDAWSGVANGGIVLNRIGSQTTITSSNKINNPPPADLTTTINGYPNKIQINFPIPNLFNFPFPTTPICLLFDTILLDPGIARDLGTRTPIDPNNFMIILDRNLQNPALNLSYYEIRELITCALFIDINGEDKLDIRYTDFGKILNVKIPGDLDIEPGQAREFKIATLEEITEAILKGFIPYKNAGGEAETFFTEIRDIGTKEKIILELPILYIWRYSAVQGWTLINDDVIQDQINDSIKKVQNNLATNIRKCLIKFNKDFENTKTLKTIRLRDDLLDPRECERPINIVVNKELEKKILVTFEELGNHTFKTDLQQVPGLDPLENKEFKLWKHKILSISYKINK